MADDDKAERPGQDRHKGIAVEIDRPRLHQHDDAARDERHGESLPRPSPEPPRQPAFADCDSSHLRTAPKVMPRNRCLRRRMVNSTIGTTNSVVAAATAGQSCPPSPMMKGMNGGIVCASPLVSNTANAYSFQEKIRQKIAVAAMPVTACGSTTLRNACSRV